MTELTIWLAPEVVKNIQAGFDQGSGGEKMVDDPPTCPTRHENQVPFAFVVAFASFLFLILVGAVYFLPAGLLVANAW